MSPEDPSAQRQCNEGSGDDPVIRTTPLQRTYRRSSTGAVDAVSFPALEIDRGGLVAIIGASGVGKTTLLNMLSGLDRPEIGDRTPVTPEIQLRLGGGEVDIARKPDALPHRQLSFIFQQGHLLSNATLGLNVALPSLTHGKSVSQERVDSLLEAVGLDEKAFRLKRAWQLSGGEAQRVSFARAFAHEPEIVFADEPTSSLDIDAARRLLTWIKEEWLAPAPERTVLWVTHELDLVAEFADRVMVLQKGSGEPDTPSRLLRPIPALENTAESHQRLLDWVYGRKVFPGLIYRSSEPNDGAATALSEISTSDPPPRAAAPSDSFVGREMSHLKLGFRLACSEMLSRRAALANDGRQRPLSEWLAETGPTGRHRGLWRRFWAAVSAYQDYRPGAVLALSFLLLGLASGAYAISQGVYIRTVSDPLNCQVAITGKAGEAARPIDHGALKNLKTRPWHESFDRTSLAPPPGRDYPLASCKKGPGAFGRRDFRTWPLGVLENGICVDARLSVPVLVTDPNEPLFEKIVLIHSVLDDTGRQAPNPGTLQELLFDEDYFVGDDAYVTGQIVEAMRTNTGLDDFDAICLIDSLDTDTAFGKNSFPLQLTAVVENIPSPKRKRYEIIILDETYRRLSVAMGQDAEPYSNAVLYFDPETQEVVSAYVSKRWLHATEDFVRIENAVRNAKLGMYLILGIAAAFGLVVVLSLVASSLEFLQLNQKAFAVLLSFGVEHALLWNIIANRFFINLHLFLVPILLAIALVLILDIGRGIRDDLSIGPGVLMFSGAIGWLAVMVIGSLASFISVWWWRRRNKFPAEILA